MKTIFYTTTIFLCLFMAGCSKDDKAADTQPRLEVIQTDATFDATGGTGSIQVKSVTPVSAVSDADWCKVSVSSQTVTITVDKNGSIEGRTAMVTIASGDERTKVPISQPGDVLITDLRNYVFPGGGGSQAFDVRYVLSKPQVGKMPDWLTYQWEDNTLTVIAAAVASEENRVCEFSLTHLGRTQIYTFRQLASVAGNYNFAYFDSKTRKIAINNASVKKGQDGTYTVDISKIYGTRFDAKLVAQYRDAELEFEFKLPQYIQADKTSHLYLCGYASPTEVSWSNKLRYTAKAEYTKDGKLMFVFSDSKNTWPGKLNGFAVAAFSGKIESNDKDEDVKKKFLSTVAGAPFVIMTQK